MHNVLGHFVEFRLLSFFFSLDLRLAWNLLICKLCLFEIRLLIKLLYDILRTSTAYYLILILVQYDSFYASLTFFFIIFLKLLHLRVLWRFFILNNCSFRLNLCDWCNIICKLINLRFCFIISFWVLILLRFLTNFHIF